MSDSALIAMIRRIVRDTVEHSKPADIVYGEVLEVSPLEVSINSKITLDDDDVDVLANASYEVGDKVALMRTPGGQSYLLLDKVVSEDDTE